MKPQSTFLSLLVAAATLVALPSSGHAAEFYSITSVTSTTEAMDLFPVGNLIEGSGVGFDANPPHDRTSGSTWVTDAPNGGAGDYFDPLPDPSPVLVFDLGSDVELSEISVWGYADTNANGANQFSLRFATEAEGAGGFGTSITFNPTFMPTQPVTPRQSFLFGDSVIARYVELTPEDNFFGINPPGGDRVGLGEVAFEILNVGVDPGIEVQGTLLLPTSSMVQTANLPVRNLGEQDLTISGTSWTGANAAAFSTVSVPASLGELETGNIEIQLNPAGLSPGPVSATLQIMSNDPDTPTAEVDVTSTVPEAGAEFFPIQSIEADTAGADLWPAANLIQGPGAGYDMNPPHNQLGSGPTHRWVTAACGFPCDYIETTGMPVLTIDLGEDRPLSEISVWGYAATNANGLTEFSLRFATSSDGPTGFGNSIIYNPTFGGAPPDDGLPNDDVTRMSLPFEETAFARYVEFTCLDNWFIAPGDGGGGETPGGDRVGLGEIAFQILPPISNVPFQIIQIDYNDGQPAFVFASKPGLNYAVERSLDLQNWIELDDGVPALGEETPFQDTALPPGTARAFYRVRRL